jgi:hypothetical protein
MNNSPAPAEEEENDDEQDEDPLGNYEETDTDNEDGDELTGWMDYPWYNPANRAPVQAAFAAARTRDQEELREFVEDEEREEAAIIPAAALVAAAAGNAAAMVATAAAEAAAAIVKAVAAEDAEAKRREPSTEDKAWLREVIRSGSFWEHGLTEERVAEGRALVAILDARERAAGTRAAIEAAIAQRHAHERAAGRSRHHGTWGAIEAAGAATAAAKAAAEVAAAATVAAAAAAAATAVQRPPGTGGRTASKATLPLLLLSLCTVVATTDATDCSHPPTHGSLAYSWRCLHEGVEEGYEEYGNEGHPTYEAKTCKEGTPLAKYDHQAMTRRNETRESAAWHSTGTPPLRAPRSPFFGRHGPCYGSCVHGSCAHGARDRQPPVHGRGQTPKRARSNRTARKRKRKRRTPRSPTLARQATGSSAPASAHMHKEGLGFEYPADHSPYADDPVLYYPPGKIVLHSQTSTKTNPRKASYDYLRKKHPMDPKITAEGWILDDRKSVQDSLGGVHKSIRAWKVYLGISPSYKARYDGGMYDFGEPTDVRQNNQALVAHLLDLSQGAPAPPTTSPPIASGTANPSNFVEAPVNTPGILAMRPRHLARWRMVDGQVVANEGRLKQGEDVRLGQPVQQTQVKPGALPRPWIEVAQDGTMGARAWLAQELNNIGRQQVNPLRHPVDQSPLTQTSGRKLRFSRSPQDTVEKLAANEFFTLYKELYPQQAREHEQHLVAQGLAMVANAKDSQEQAKFSRTQSDTAESEPTQQNAPSEVSIEEDIWKERLEKEAKRWRRATKSHRRPHKPSECPRCQAARAERTASRPSGSADASTQTDNIAGGHGGTRKRCRD